MASAYPVIDQERAMARLLAMAGHDLKQPLQVALLSLERAADEPLTPRSMWRLRKAVEALNRLDRELTDLARISQLGTTSPQLQGVALDDVMKRVERDWQYYAETCRVHLAIKPQDLSVRSDPVLLHSMVRNLVGNAIRYSSSGDRVTVDCVPHGSSVVHLRVSDEGRGIPHSHIEHIFDAFVRGEDVDDRGLGLGLAIVRQLADSLGHRVSVQSEENVGSTFTISLPLVASRPGLPDRD